MAKKFTFNGTSSDNYNLICTDINHLSFATKSYESIKIPGRTGNLIIDDGSYENKSVSIVAYLDLRDKSGAQKKTIINNIKTWLIKPVGYKTLVFDDTIEYQAICSKVECANYSTDYIEFTIEFEVAEVFN